MKTVANLFATSYARLGSDHQQDRQFISLERLAPEEDSYCTFVKRVESIAQNEYWIAREKNILMLLKRVPHVARLRKEGEKSDDSYQSVKTKDAGISLAHWLRTKPRLASDNSAIKHPLIHVQTFLQFARYSLIALREIHQAGVIHAQLRPDNICIPYQPHPYTFDTPLQLHFHKLSLIDFMFAVSNTLKLSRPLPVLVAEKASTQSALMRHALLTDQQQRHADLITKIDYSVDLYALGFILEQIFQHDLVYPTGLDAELSMDIHRLILELKSYDHGIPESVKLRHLYLHPHNEYIAKIDHLLNSSLQRPAPESIELLFDPAQFLEEDSIFNVSPTLTNKDKIGNAEHSASIRSTLESVANSALPLETSVETQTMKENKSSSLGQKQEHIELSKITVIALIISLQIMYVLYTDGNAMGLDVLASMGLVAVIGSAVMFAGKLFAPSSPLPKHSIMEDDIATSVPPIITQNINNDMVNAASTSVVLEQADSNTIVDNTPSTKNEDEQENTPPPVMLFNKASEPIKDSKDDEAMEINKWVVIAIIIACQLAYVGLTTDFGGKNTSSTADTETAPVEPVVEPTPTETPPTDNTIVEEVPTEPTTPTTEASAANIELLSETSTVSTPQVAAPKTRSKDSAPDSMLLSGSPVTQAKVKPEKTPAVAKTKEVTEEAPRQTAIPLTKEQAEAADKPPVAETPTIKEPSVADTKTESKDTKTEVKASPKSLTRGLAEAQNAMGVHYYHGDGVKKDTEEAFKWFQKAANLGQPNAQFNLGMMYQKGEGVKQDLAEAAKWYRKSAEQGNASSQLNLGMMYISGRGVRQNIDEGAKLLSQAADQGDSTAKANLAWLLQQGYIKAAPSGE